MNRKIFLTFTLLLSLSAWGQVFSEQELKTHLRWNLHVQKDEIIVSKSGKNVDIQTMSLSLFEKLTKEMKALSLNQNYLTTMEASKENYPSKPASIKITLKDDSIELFSFYRDGDKKYILDFWINADVANKLKLEQLPTQKLAVPEKVAPVKKVVIKMPIKDLNQVKSQSDYRDFRYGASFIWDYPAVVPKLERDIQLASKTPDDLYPIKDRSLLDDPKEAHLQLSINFYRERNWGLMNKSISLYQKKYGRDQNHVLNEYMKANSLLRSHIQKPNKGLAQSAMAILSTLKEQTTDVSLRISILRYLIQYYADLNDQINVLEFSKQLYVEASSELDRGFQEQAATTILHALAELKQVDKMSEFLKDKKVIGVLAPQVGLAYKSYAQLSRGETSELIKDFKKVEKSLAKPIHPTLLFNLAESYFREANFVESKKYFQEYLETYSYVIDAPKARLRSALCSELLDEPFEQVSLMYKNAIDRSTTPEVRYEAKLRFVGMNTGRRIKLDPELDYTIFLEQSPDEAKSMTPDLKKLLWLVRLRSYLTARKYDEALTYLTSIPLDLMKPSEKRVFDGDGAEIIYGNVQSLYLKEDYSQVIKMWETYKNKYEDKVAKNLYLNFVVSDSYLKLGLLQSFDKSLFEFRKVSQEEPRTFPIWVDRIKLTNLTEMVEELVLARLVSDKKWVEASDKLASLPVSVRDSMNSAYYQGVINFHLKKYQEAVAELEKVLISENKKNQLTPRQTAEVLMTYVDSLYQLKDLEKFKTVVRALGSDISQSKSASILNVAERIQYLLIETIAGEGQTDWKEVEVMTRTFKTKFQKSPYIPRISYLYGLSLLKNAKTLEGREVLNSLTKDEKVPSHIRELCRSELVTLELMNKKF